MTLYRYLNAAGEAWQDSDGAPLAGGLLYFYLAGTTTPQATYTDSGGGTANSNPVVLNASGRIPNDVWLTGGISYKAELQDADGVTIQTWDNITGINDTTGLESQEWVAGPDLTYISGSSATAIGDQREIYQRSRRVELTSGAGTVYGTIAAEPSFDAGTNTTTITWVLDSGSVTNPITGQRFGMLSADNPSVPAFVNVRTVKQEYTRTGNAGSAETTIGTYTIPAEFLPVGKGMRLVAWGQGNASDNVTVKLKWGALNLTMHSGAVLPVGSSGGWSVDIWLCRYATGTTNNTRILIIWRTNTTTQMWSYGPDVDFTSDSDVEITGQNTADTSDNAVVCDGFIAQYI